MPSRRVLVAALAWPFACGFSVSALTPKQQAAVAAHYTNNDPNWSILSLATVGEDRMKGLLTASFPDKIKSLQGHPFKISGFMSPIETTNETKHFIVTRRSTTCPFCPPNEPTEAVEVRLTKPTRFTDDEVMVQGRLQLVASSDEGLFYILDDASLAMTSRD